jgi:HsdM N-terminal domain
MDKTTIPPLPVNQDEINNILWRACDTFRGTIDASEYKNYLLVMLFVKYVSDSWTEHYEQLQVQYGDDEESGGILHTWGSIGIDVPLRSSVALFILILCPKLLEIRL